jgi:hypothetical protein
MPHGDRRAIDRGRQASSSHELVAGKPANPPHQFQDAERGRDLRRGQAGVSDRFAATGRK